MPDLIYLSPNGRRVLAPETLYQQAFIEKLNDIVPDMSVSSFDLADLKTWETDNRDIYGISIYAVSHGVYYNTEIFNKLDLTPPQTWKELLVISQIIKDAGIIPIANGT